jgi:hypothetical protein
MLLARRIAIDDLGRHAGALTYASVLSIPPRPRLRDHVLGTIVFIIGFEGLVALGGIYFGHVISKASALISGRRPVAFPAPRSIIRFADPLLGHDPLTLSGGASSPYSDLKAIW